MKRIYIIIIAVFALIQVSEAQQQPLYSQYMLNSFLLNPGITGTEEIIPIRLTARQQWTGIDGAPQTQAISAHSALGRSKEMGVGGFIYNDKFGPIGRTGIMGTYSYKIRIKSDTKLSFGLSLSAFQYKMDETNINIIDESDVVFTGSTETSIVPDANFGAYLYNPKYFAGFSSTQLFQFQIKLDGSTNLSKIVRHYYVTAGYRFKAGESFEIEPSFLVKTTAYNMPQLDLNARFFYKKNYWLAFSYRTEDAVIAMLGLKVDKYYIGYAFDYTLSNLINYSSGSHEIMLGIDLGKVEETKSLF
ncbi:MAG: hypothetical protein A2W91_16185 [Bacteroidetes bacterium GWF2_38_335]|nr:MAG: hypothetical protein A2W91_16185 [Bacteroidetes bacterium GWF2_38_335]OFY81229.1 MAG: hypothetical protein A2281_07160 [Bacteroidetes bacterium RIFOXYA12_FULL_38_20]HBS85345.1 hypothetical protein [Bacteroidales bacterium]